MCASSGNLFTHAQGGVLCANGGADSAADCPGLELALDAADARQRPASKEQEHDRMAIHD
jgi:hypothetical protein